jgi:hypothetical protein
MKPNMSIDTDPQQKEAAWPLVLVVQSFLRLERMKMSIEARRRWLVAACFSAVIGFSVVVGYGLGLLPSFHEKCVAQCLPQEGHMVPLFPRTMTGAKEGQKVCKCFALGTYR